MSNYIENDLNLFKYGLFVIIEVDIEGKYKIKKPRFMIGGLIVGDPYIIEDWVYFQFSQRKWVQYKYVKNEVFELKEYFPHPPTDVCNKIIDDVFEDLNKNYENVYYKISDVIYNEKQARKEMMSRLRLGYENIYYDEPVLDQKKRNICKLIFYEEGEEERSLAKGYLILEEK